MSKSPMNDDGDDDIFAREEEEYTYSQPCFDPDIVEEEEVVAVDPKMQLQNKFDELHSELKKSDASSASSLLGRLLEALGQYHLSCPQHEIVCLWCEHELLLEAILKLICRTPQDATPIEGNLHIHKLYNEFARSLSCCEKCLFAYRCWMNEMQDPTNSNKENDFGERYEEILKKFHIEDVKSFDAACRNSPVSQYALLELLHDPSLWATRAPSHQINFGVLLCKKLETLIVEQANGKEKLLPGLLRPTAGHCYLIFARSPSLRSWAEGIIKASGEINEGQHASFRSCFYHLFRAFALQFDLLPVKEILSEDELEQWNSFRHLLQAFPKHAFEKLTCVEQNLDLISSLKQRFASSALDDANFKRLIPHMLSCLRIVLHFSSKLFSFEDSPRGEFLSLGVAIISCPLFPVLMAEHDDASNDESLTSWVSAFCDAVITNYPTPDDFHLSTVLSFFGDAFSDESNAGLQRSSFYCLLRVSKSFLSSRSPPELLLYFFGKIEFFEHFFVQALVNASFRDRAINLLAEYISKIGGLLTKRKNGSLPKEIDEKLQACSIFFALCSNLSGDAKGAIEILVSRLSKEVAHRIVKVYHKTMLEKWKSLFEACEFAALRNLFYLMQYLVKRSSLPVDFFLRHYDPLCLPCEEKGRALSSLTCFDSAAEQEARYFLGEWSNEFQEHFGKPVDSVTDGYSLSPCVPAIHAKLKEFKRLNFEKQRRSRLKSGSVNADSPIVSAENHLNDSPTLLREPTPADSHHVLPVPADLGEVSLDHPHALNRAHGEGEINPQPEIVPVTSILHPSLDRERVTQKSHDDEAHEEPNVPSTEMGDDLLDFPPPPLLLHPPSNELLPVSPPISIPSEKEAQPMTDSSPANLILSCAPSPTPQDSDPGSDENIDRDADPEAIERSVSRDTYSISSRSPTPEVFSLLHLQPAQLLADHGDKSENFLEHSIASPESESQDQTEVIVTLDSDDEEDIELPPSRPSPPPPPSSSRLPQDHHSSEAISPTVSKNEKSRPPLHDDIASNNEKALIAPVKRPPREEITPDTLTHIILTWSFDDEEISLYNAKAKPVDSVYVFSSFQEYEAHFRKLLIYEVREELASSFQQYRRMPRSFGYVKEIDTESGGGVVNVKCELTDSMDVNEGHILQVVIEKTSTVNVSALCYVQKVERKSLRLKFFLPLTNFPHLRSFRNALRPELRVSVVWIGNFLPAERQYKAIVSLRDSRLKNLFFFKEFDCYCTSSIRTFRKLETFPPDTIYNDAQKYAIQACLDFSTSLSFLHGPPGTGKTYTLKGFVSIYMDLIYKTNVIGRPGVQTDSLFMSQNGPLLVCAASNTAVDNLVKSLIRLNSRPSHVNKKISIVRLGAPEKVDKKVTEYSLDALVEQKILPDVQDLKKKEDQLLENKKIIQEIESAKRQGKPPGKSPAQQKALHERVRSLESEIPKLSRAIDFSRAKARKEILQSSHIICSTLNSSALSSLSDVGKSIKIVVVDEAAQCTEPDLLIPLQYGAEKLVLFGDPYQLAPTVKSKYAKGLNLTYLERIMPQMEKLELVYLLNHQYRMHPEISQFPNLHFYGGRLCDEAKNVDEPWNQNESLGAYRVYDIMGFTEQEKSSRFNISEVMLVLHLVLEYLTWRAKAPREPNQGKLRLDEVLASIAIITPYNAQKTKIQEYSQKLLKATLRVGTVDGFQGQESDVIIYSAVCADSNLGFTDDGKRINVALTRAKKAFWLVGSAKTLRRSPDWRALLENAEEREVLFEAPRVGDFDELQHRFDGLSSKFNLHHDRSTSPSIRSAQLSKPFPPSSSSSPPPPIQAANDKRNPLLTSSSSRPLTVKPPSTIRPSSSSSDPRPPNVSRTSSLGSFRLPNTSKQLSSSPVVTKRQELLNSIPTTRAIGRDPPPPSGPPPPLIPLPPFPQSGPKPDYLQSMERRSPHRDSRSLHRDSRSLPHDSRSLPHDPRRVVPSSLPPSKFEMSGSNFGRHPTTLQTPSGKPHSNSNSSQYRFHPQLEFPQEPPRRLSSSSSSPADPRPAYGAPALKRKDDAPQDPRKKPRP